MKKAFACFFFLLFGWISAALAQSDGYAVTDIPMVHLQDRARYVCNPDGILSSEAVAAMDTTLFALEQETGIQILVVAVRSIAGGDCFDFAYRLGKENGVGQKGKDNGLVVLLVTEERCIQMATGYGLEGDLPDAICKRIQTQYMNKAFAEGRWDEGMLNGIQAIRGQLTGKGSPPDRQTDDKGSDMPALMLVLACVLFVPAWAWFLNRKNTKCPACGKHRLYEISSRIVARSYGAVTEEVTCVCQKCGYKVTRIRRKNDDNYHHRGGGPFIGGFFPGGFGRGGGGFSGGSFGGGSFGGGGAGSRF